MVYSLELDTWDTSYPSLPKAMNGSSAVIMEPHDLYNFGGYSSKESILYLDMSAIHMKWKALNLAGATFVDWYYREAIVLNTIEGEKIVYLGSKNNKATYVLEKESTSSCELTLVG